MLNSVFLMGRTVEDLKVVTLETGTKVCKMVLAVNRDYKNENGELETDFIPVQLWNVVAENTAEYCKKGSTVCVKGRIIARTNEIEGVKFKMLEITGDKVIFVSSKS